MWNQVLKIVTYLDGKKTFIVSALATLNGVVQLANGHKWQQIIPYLLAGAFGVTIRLAIAKVEAKLPPVVDDIINSQIGIDKVK